MDQKKSFILDYESGSYTMCSLCTAYGISRKTGYNIIARYKADGISGLAERSSRPHYQPTSTPDFVVEKILFWRDKKPRNPYGAKKIQVLLADDYIADAIPSVTTIHNILNRHNRVEARKYRRRIVPSNPVFDPTSCNEIWSIDYKGYFFLGNGKKCYPLTVCDSFSRFVIEVKGQHKESWRGAQKVLRGLFREYGQPESLHSDNGSPFASSQSPCGFGSLSYWLIDLGIKPVFSDPGCPTQNGRHERMHKDLKAECCRPGAKNLSCQNRRHSKFKRLYNEERPHEGIGQRRPAEVHVKSDRQYVERVGAYEYDIDLSVRRVCSSGALRWGSYDWVHVSNCLAGKYIGLKEVGERMHEIYYRDTCLGYFKEGEQVNGGNYYVLTSDRDLPARDRYRKSRSRQPK